MPRASDMAAGQPPLLEIALVVFFGTPESLRRFDPGDDASRLESPFRSQLLDLGPGLRFLFGGMEEDGGSVLRAPVGTLPVQRGGIVQRKEGIEQLFVGDLLRIEFQF